MSLLYRLFHLHSAGGFARQTSIAAGAQQDRVVGGMQAIGNRVVDRLGPRVRLGTPVRSLRQQAGSVVVASDRVAVRARRLERLRAGPVYKIALVYDEPFWRRDGFSGQSLVPASPLAITIDACGPTVPPGILNAFAAGPGAEILGRMDPAARRRFAVAEMTARFGPKAAGRTRLHRAGVRERGVDARLLHGALRARRLTRLGTSRASRSAGCTGPARRRRR